MSISDLTNPKPIGCGEADRVRYSLKPYSSLTNYFKGDPSFSDPRLPHMTATTWMNKDEVPVLHEELDEDGCRHWLGE